MKDLVRPRHALGVLKKLGTGCVLSYRLITSVDDYVDPSRVAKMDPVALEGGPIRAEIASCDLQGVVIDVAEYSFASATRGRTLEDRIAVMVPLHVDGHLNGERLEKSGLVAAGPLTEVEGTFSAGSAGIVSIPVAEMEGACRALGLEPSLPAAGETRAVHTPKSRALERIFDNVMYNARATRHRTLDQDVVDGVRSLVVDVVAQALSTEGATRRTAPRSMVTSVQIARTCTKYAADRQYHGVTIAELCDVARVSERRLRQAFYECYDMSPTAYLRVVALHCVRRQLCEGPMVRDAVSRAATEYGFWHLSRFAAQYRDLFGEHPSDTLQRRSVADTRMLA